MESKYAGMSPYNYSFNNPIMFNDLNGADPGEPPNKGWVPVKSHFNTFNEDGTNRSGQEYGYVDVKGTGNYEKMSASEYWNKFGHNKEYIPAFNSVHPGTGLEYSSGGGKSSSKTKPIGRTIAVTPSTPVVAKTVTTTTATTVTNTASESTYNFLSWDKVKSGAYKALDITTNFMPFSGSKDLYAGFERGDYWQVANGAASMTLDAISLGYGSKIAKSLDDAIQYSSSLLAMAFGTVGKNTATTGGNVLRHYTNEAGYKAIMESKELLPSLGLKNARYGAGQYFTDIVSSEYTSGQVSSRLFRVPWNKHRLTHFIDIDINGLNVIKNKSHNFFVPGLSPLPLDGRIMNHGTSIFKPKL